MMNNMTKNTIKNTGTRAAIGPPGPGVTGPVVSTFLVPLSRILMAADAVRIYSVIHCISLRCASIYSLRLLPIADLKAFLAVGLC